MSIHNGLVQGRTQDGQDLLRKNLNRSESMVQIFLEGVQTLAHGLVHLLLITGHRRSKHGSQTYFIVFMETCYEGSG